MESAPVLALRMPSKELPANRNRPSEAKPWGTASDTILSLRRPGLQGSHIADPTNSSPLQSLRRPQLSIQSKRIQEECDRIAASRQLYQLDSTCARITEECARIKDNVHSLGMVELPVVHEEDPCHVADCIFCQAKLEEEQRLRQQRVAARAESASTRSSELQDYAKVARVVRLEAQRRRMEAERRKEEIVQAKAEARALAAAGSFTEDSTPSSVSVCTLRPLPDEIEDENVTVRRKGKGSPDTPESQASSKCAPIEGVPNCSLFFGPCAIRTV